MRSDTFAHTGMRQVLGSISAVEQHSAASLLGAKLSVGILAGAVAIVISASVVHRQLWGLSLVPILVLFAVYSLTSQVRVVTLHLGPTTSELRGSGWHRVVQTKNLTLRRGAGYLRSSTPATAWGREWNGQPSESACTLLVVVGRRRYGLVFGSAAEATDAAHDIRRAVHGESSTYRA